ncbi:hypothetical protein T484DRAFT_1760844, partial [Baffinella frigidus]
MYARVGSLRTVVLAREGSVRAVLAREGGSSTVLAREGSKRTVLVREDSTRAVSGVAARVDSGLGAKSAGKGVGEGPGIVRVGSFARGGSTVLARGGSVRGVSAAGVQGVGNGAGVHGGQPVLVSAYGSSKNLKDDARESGGTMGGRGEEGVRDPLSAVEPSVSTSGEHVNFRHGSQLQRTSSGSASGPAIFGAGDKIEGAFFGSLSTASEASFSGNSGGSAPALARAISGGMDAGNSAGSSSTLSRAISGGALSTLGCAISSVSSGTLMRAISGGTDAGEEWL